MDRCRRYLNGGDVARRMLKVSFLVSLVLHAAILVIDWRPSGQTGTFHKQLVIQAHLQKKAAPADVAMTNDLATRLASVTTYPEKSVRGAEIMPAVESAPTPNAPLPLTVKKSILKTVASTLREDSVQPEVVFSEEEIDSNPNGPPRQVDMEFEIFAGEERKFVGKAEVRYSSRNGETYSMVMRGLRDQFITDGAAAERWKIEVYGQIRQHGLSPEIYESSGGTSDRLLGVAGSRLDRNIGEQNGHSADGLLDRQSLMFNFMHKPPLRSGKVLIADGRRYTSFSYTRDGVETVKSALLGEIHAEKYSFKSDETKEQIEFWLWVKQKYLPVRVRYIDPLGVVTEQVVLTMTVR
ncbi:MAG: hypothetical protein RLZZ298_1146 [Pseudomonadota bacterium]|jgi:hypothetical protein